MNTSNPFFNIGTALLRQLDPERAHRAALAAIRLGVVPTINATNPQLHVQFLGKTLRHPVGIAAGFDKNCDAIIGLHRMGFDLIEVGTVTPQPQQGNQVPRIFRLEEDKAIINRMGFPNNGAVAAEAALARDLDKIKAARRKNLVLGISIGANKDSEDRLADYANGVERFSKYADYLAINISSPNTEGLRDLQHSEALQGLLDAVMTSRAKLPVAEQCAIYVKLAPDISDDGLEATIETLVQFGVEGLIAVNTTLERDGLKSKSASEAGGLSGEPLRSRADQVLKLSSQIGRDRLDIIGVGGISDAKSARQKLLLGASAVQLYTGLIYGGPNLLSEIVENLATE